MEAYGENCPEELRNPEDLKLISEPLDFLGMKCLPERTSGIGWSGGISRGEESLRSTGDCNEVAGDTGESVLCTEVPTGKIQTSHRNYGERTVLSRLGIPGR